MSLFLGKDSFCRHEWRKKRSAIAKWDSREMKRAPSLGEVAKGPLVTPRKGKKRGITRKMRRGNIDKGANL